MKIIAVLLLSLVNLELAAQDHPLQYDSLPTKLLNEVVISSVNDEGDTLQTFFRGNNAATTEDILNRLPKLSLIRRGGFGQEPVIRSMSGGQINMTIDGMKMFGACTDKMDPVSIYVEPQNLKQIDVQSGSNGAAMGSTVGGSVDMQLADARFTSKKVMASAGTNYQSVSNGMHAYINANLSGKRSAYYGSLNFRNAGNYTDGRGRQVMYSQYEKINFSGSSKWKVGNDTLSANVLVDRGKNIGFPALPMDVGSANASLYALTYSRYRCHGFLQNLKTKIYYNSVKHIMDDSQRKDVLMKMDMPGSSITTGLFAEASLHQLGKHRVSLRVDSYHNRSSAEMTMYSAGEPSMYLQTWPESSRTAAGIYVQDIYKLSRSTRINVNTRIDFFSSSLFEGIGNQQLQVFYPDMKRNAAQVLKSLNASIDHWLSPKLSLGVHTGYGERAASLNEFYGYYLFNRYDGYDYIGNPFLMKEKNFNSDISLSYFSDLIQLELNGFYNWLPDYIFPEVLPSVAPLTPRANGVKTFRNIDHATLLGSELTAMVSIAQNVKYIQVVKYVQGDDDKGNPLPLIAPLSSLSSVTYQTKMLRLTAEGDLALKQNRINDSFGEDATSGFFVLNLRGSFDHQVGSGIRIRYNAGIENIFDRYYHQHLDWGNIKRPGRNFYFGAAVSF